jgi:hypothetical protein
MMYVTYAFFELDEVFKTCSCMYQGQPCDSQVLTPWTRRNLMGCQKFGSWPIISKIAWSNEITLE